MRFPSGAEQLHSNANGKPNGKNVSGNVVQAGSGMMTAVSCRASGSHLLWVWAHSDSTGSPPPTDTHTHIGEQLSDMVMECSSLVTRHHPESHGCSHAKPEIESLSLYASITMSSMYGGAAKHAPLNLLYPVTYGSVANTASTFWWFAGWQTCRFLTASQWLKFNM